MKKLFILSALALGFAGCKSYETFEERASRVPYGGFGEYGFTYDLDNSPSPFVDASYRPLTAFDLAAPIVVVVTNQPPSRYIVAEPAALVGGTPYSGATVGGTTAISGSPAFVEPAGAQANVSSSVTPNAAPPVAGTAPNSYGGNAIVVPSNDVNIFQTNASTLATNGTSTTNSTGFANNTNAFGGITNTNAFAGGTNRLINEPAGTQLQTNRPFGEPPGTEFRTNQFGEPAVPPNSETNRTSLTPPAPSTPPQNQPSPNPAPVQNPQVPPASAPQDPPQLPTP